MVSRIPLQTARMINAFLSSGEDSPIKLVRFRRPSWTGLHHVRPALTTHRFHLKTLTVFDSWSKPLTVALLQLIKSNPTYRQALFPSGASKTLRWMVARDVCIQMFKDELWMLDAERRGLVRAMVEGGWEATDTWKSTITNPVVTHIYE